MTRTSDFKLFRLAADNTPYRKLPALAGRRVDQGGRTVLCVEPDALRILAAAAFHDVSFFLRKPHLDALAAIPLDPAASENDRFVAAALVRNAVLSAGGELPLCQDTGIATIIAHKGENVFTGADDVACLACGVRETWQRDNLRYSVVAPRSMTVEENTENNLPAQIDIAAVPGSEYHFLFIAKGGGSSNKTMLCQEAPGILDDQRLARFLAEKIKALGVAACPPYHLAVVIGGLSPEMTLKTVKLATAGYLDTLPDHGDATGSAFRDHAWERKAMELCEASGLGAQFGGRHFALDTRVIRLPRHAGSCPIGIGISCSADRNIRGKITAEGVFLEKLETDLSGYLPGLTDRTSAPEVRISLDQPMDEIRRQLAACKPGTRVRLDGCLIVARDLAHARLHAGLAGGKPLPEYLKQHPIYYAGPAKTPPGMASGSFGPTTAQRMDMFIRDFMQRGASLVTLAKGQRSAEFTACCREFGGFYLGTIGGAAALVASENIIRSEIVDFEDLGMEAVRRITVKDLPAFVICDDKGNNLYA
ncbi:MAG: FumA C-terminus/TtdB family hydratase beta subunit [bacterium]